MVVKKNIKLSGFSNFEMTKPEYNEFIKNTKKDYFITLDNTEKFSCYLEVDDKNLKKINTCLVYVFYLEKKKICFKLSKLTLGKSVNKKELLAKKAELLKFILLKIDFIDYDFDLFADRPYGIFKF